MIVKRLKRSGVAEMLDKKWNEEGIGWPSPLIFVVRRQIWLGGGGHDIILTALLTLLFRHRRRMHRTAPPLITTSQASFVQHRETTTSPTADHMPSRYGFPPRPH